MAYSPLLDMTSDEIAELQEYVETMLGGEDVDVDIIQREVKVAARRALKVYVSEVNQWQVRNQFPSIMGFKASQNFTNFFIQDNQMMAQRMSDWWAAMARVGGKIRWKKDYIELEKGRQTYDMAKESSEPYVHGTRRIHKILWYATPEIFPADYVFDLALGNMWSFGQAGMTYGTSSLSYVGQMQDIVLLTQSFALRDKILFSEFYYNISGDVIEISPMPGSGMSIPHGAKLFYYYYDEQDYMNIDVQDPSNPDETLIANPLQVQVNNVPYSNLNTIAKTWVDDYTLALCKYIQAAKWRKVRSIASPDAEYQVEFNFDSLLQESDADREKLVTDLKEYLATMNWDTMMQKQAEMSDNSVKINTKSPRLFFKG